MKHCNELLKVTRSNLSLAIYYIIIKLQMYIQGN